MLARKQLRQFDVPTVGVGGTFSQDASMYLSVAVAITIGYGGYALGGMLGGSFGRALGTGLGIVAGMQVADRVIRSAPMSTDPNA